MSNDLFDPTPHLDDTLAELGKIYKPIGNPINVYKFRIVSGKTLITKNGEEEKFVDVNNQPQFLNLANGKEPITITWSGSSILTADNENNLNTTYKVGEYEKCYSTGDFSNANETQNRDILGVEFAIDLNEKSISLESGTWIPEVSDQINYVYIILDKRSPSPQLLTLKSYSLSFNEKTNEVFKSVLNFESVNLKYANTGQQILDFFQFGAIGSGYAWPKEILNTSKEVEVILDNEKLVSEGISSLQVDFVNGAALSSVHILGTAINPDTGFKTETPYKLFVHRIKYPKKSNLFFDTSTSNFYTYENALPEYNTYWEDFQEKAKTINGLSNYNLGETKEFIGGLALDPIVVESSNPIDALNNEYSYEISNNELTVDLKGSYDFKAINGVKNANFAGTEKRSIAMFLNINSYANFYIDELKFSSKENVKYALSKVLGILGGIFDIVVNGLDIGWTSGTKRASGQPINLIFPCETWNIGTLTSSARKYLPLEMLSDNKPASSIPFQNSQLSSYNMELTNLILDTSQQKPLQTAGKGLNGIWNTKYIGQYTYEDGTYINDDKSLFEINLETTTTLPADPNVTFIVDYINIKAIYSGDMRITAYTRKYNPIEEKFTEQSIYSSIFSTKSKIRNKIRLITTEIKFNYWEEFNTIGQVKWPILVLPPEPDPIDKIEILRVYKDNNNIVFNQKNITPLSILNDFIITGIIVPVEFLNPIFFNKDQNFNINMSFVPYLIFNQYYIEMRKKLDKDKFRNLITTGSLSNPIWDISGSVTLLDLSTKSSDYLETIEYIIIVIKFGSKTEQFKLTYSKDVPTTFTTTTSLFEQNQLVNKNGMVFMDAGIASAPITLSYEYANPTKQLLSLSTVINSLSIEIVTNELQQLEITFNINGIKAKVNYITTEGIRDSVNANALDSGVRTMSLGGSFPKIDAIISGVYLIPRGILK